MRLNLVPLDYKVVFDNYCNDNYDASFDQPVAKNGSSRIIPPHMKAVDLTGIYDRKIAAHLDQTFYRIRLRDKSQDYKDGMYHYDAYREILIGLINITGGRGAGDLVGYSVGGNICHLKENENNIKELGVNYGSCGGHNLGTIVNPALFRIIIDKEENTLSIIVTNDGFYTKMNDDTQAGNMVSDKALPYWPTPMPIEYEKIPQQTTAKTPPSFSQTAILPWGK